MSRLHLLNYHKLIRGQIKVQIEIIQGYKLQEKAILKYFKNLISALSSSHSVENNEAYNY